MDMIVYEPENLEISIWEKTGCQILGTNGAKAELLMALIEHQLGAEFGQTLYFPYGNIVCSCSTVIPPYP